MKHGKSRSVLDWIGIAITIAICGFLLYGCRLLGAI